MPLFHVAGRGGQTSALVGLGWDECRAQLGGKPSTEPQWERQPGNGWSLVAWGILSRLL
jgi:hypothetical protein